LDEGRGIRTRGAAFRSAVARGPTLHEARRWVDDSKDIDFLSLSDSFLQPHAISTFISLGIFGIDGCTAFFLGEACILFCDESFKQ
jgi:hypothetical protein